MRGVFRNRPDSQGGSEECQVKCQQDAECIKTFPFSRERIFLIFAHYIHFNGQGGHTGDTVVTLNDILKDIDFDITWGLLIL